jgi:hypothetical protein
VYNYFIRILISVDELCYMKDCVTKKVIIKADLGQILRAYDPDVMILGLSPMSVTIFRPYINSH